MIQWKYLDVSPQGFGKPKSDTEHLDGSITDKLIRAAKAKSQHEICRALRDVVSFRDKNTRVGVFYLQS